MMLLITFIISNSSFSQNECKAIEHKKENISRLAPGFDYKHTFEVNFSTAKNGMVEFNYILNRGTLYMLNMSNTDGIEKGLIVKLYDQQGNLVGTNYDPGTERFWPIGYACNQSGVHKIKVELVSSIKSKCGIVVLGARK